MCDSSSDILSKRKDMRTEFGYERVKVNILDRLEKRRKSLVAQTNTENERGAFKQIKEIQWD